VQSDARIEFAERKQARRNLVKFLLKFDPIGMPKFGGVEELL
jgi:hypothetical protein